MSDPKQLIELLARGLVDRPEEVEVTEQRQISGARFMVRANPDDIGRLVGREGRTVRAIRTLLNAAADLDGARYTLDISD